MFPGIRLYDPCDYPYGIGGFPFSSRLLDDYANPPHMNLKTNLPPPHMNLKTNLPRRQTIETSKIADDAKQFKVMLNVKHFLPKEIVVKMVGNCIVIRGKHEEHADEHGFVTREFTRRYQLPDDVEPHTVQSSLSQDGVLTIYAPRKYIEPPPPKNERVVPITMQRSYAQEEALKMKEKVDSIMRRDKKAPTSKSN